MAIDRNRGTSRSARARAIRPILALLALPACAVFAPANDEALHPDQACSGALGDEVTYDVEFAAVVTPPHGARVLEVWLPLPPSDGVQQVTTSELASYPIVVEPRIAAEPLYGNRFAYFEFERPAGAQVIRHHFRVRVREVRWSVDPARVRDVEEWPASFAPYLKPVAAAAEDADYGAIVETLGGPGTSQPERLFTAMDWIDANLTYDHVQASLQASADHALSARRGHCSDYHGLCQTFGRSLGTPTRVTYGIHLFPKNSPSHCKFEAFLAPYGWVSFDLSETQKLITGIANDASLSSAEKARWTATARRRLKSGFRDNTWMLWTRGTHYDLAPKASRPVAVVRTIYAEADGEPLPDPDPANGAKREFGWMTVHKYTPSRPVADPFEDRDALASW